MVKVQYKHKEGALHIGGGRFFYANEPVEVSPDEVDGLLNTYEDLEAIEIPAPVDPPQDNGGEGKRTAALLKKLNAEQQKEIIAELNGDLESAKNEEERIALILELQEQQKEKEE